jgi:hypothetical protein
VLDAVMLLADVGGTYNDAQDGAVREVRTPSHRGHGKAKHVKSHRKSRSSSSVNGSHGSSGKKAAKTTPKRATARAGKSPSGR